MKLRKSDVFASLDQNTLPCGAQTLEYQEFDWILRTCILDIITCTDQIVKDVDIAEIILINQYPYRMNPHKQEYLNEEVPSGHLVRK